MRAIIIASLIISQCYGQSCVARDGEGHQLGDAPHEMGSVRRDTAPMSFLPGELIFENLRSVSLTNGNCPIGIFLQGNRLRFTTKGVISEESACTFVVNVEADEGCPETTPNEYTIRYNIHDDGFLQDSYAFQATFPVPKGARLTDDIQVSSLGFSTRVRVEEDFDGVEIVPVGTTREGITRFEVRATRLLYLLEDLNLTMIATDGVVTWKARLTISVSEDSALPRPEFEESFYIVRLNASDLASNMTVYPAGMITLKENYTRVSFHLESLNDDGFEFAIGQETTQTVDVRLLEVPTENMTSRDVPLLLTARVSDQFGRESEGYTTLLIKINGNIKCLLTEAPVMFNSDDREHLKTAVIVLSIVVVLLLFLIIFLYLKYVCVKKPEPEIPCKKCSAPAPVKARRPTPRKISEYPYPLDVLPPPLETLTETDVEEDGGGDVNKLEVKVTTPREDVFPVSSTSAAKTRKRSMTFRESDEEARLHREAPTIAEVHVHEPERKVSNVSERRLSVEEERRRRKSSVKMYRCLT